MSDLKIFADYVEPSAQHQIDELLSQHAFANAKVRIMPDVHAGTGCVIGFTADLGDKVIPNIVGVDIGCGVLVVPFEGELDLKQLDDVIKKEIPSGRDIYSYERYSTTLLDKLYCKEELRDIDRLECSLGTLGGGNHYIEVDVDEEGHKYLNIHTGSRNLGTQVCKIYQKKAIKYCNNGEEEIKKIVEDLKSQGRQNEIQLAILDFKKTKVNIPDALCYLEGDLREKYLHDMEICQEYAKWNRLFIADSILAELHLIADWLNKIESVHNYIDSRDNIIRKGAISARKDESVVIPLNMRDGIIIGKGKGNDDWNNSAPHGAGRIMGRRGAHNNLSLNEYIQEMKGIYSTSVCLETIDESPMAYKPAQQIIDAIKDTVEITKILKPIYNFKAV